MRENQIIRRYTAVLLFGGMIFNMCLNLTGPVLSDIMTDYHISLDRGGLMSLFQFGGGIAAILLLSRLLDKMRKPVLLMVAFLVMALSLLGIGAFPPFAVFLVLYLAMGIGLCVSDVEQNAVVSDLHKDNVEAVLCFMHGLCGIGATFIPILTVILGTGNWQRIYRIVAVVILAVVAMELVIYVRGRAVIDACSPGVAKESAGGEVSAGNASPAAEESAGKERPAGGEASSGSPRQFFSDKKIWIAAASLLCFGAAQGGVTAWGVKYSRDVFAGAGPLLWSFAISFYWLGTTVCRLLVGLVPALKKWDSRKIIILGGVLAGAALLTGLLSGNIAGLLAGILCFGFLNGATLPKLLGMMNSWYPAQTGLASGVVFIALYLGLGLFPLLMGVIGAASGMLVMMMVPVAATLLSGAVGMMLPRA